ncbi:MAG: citrate transporter, partial [Ruminococcus sp.]|nr:citrate transporter [Ruminococcus sp.]
LGLVFTLLCYFSAMFVTNDVALLTFVPLTLLVYEKISDEKSRILTIVLETCAANAGSMLTPIGNPQNLYVYDEFKLSMGDFLRTMLPAGIISLAVICLLTLMLPNNPCAASDTKHEDIPKIPTAGYCALFAVCLMTVLRVVPDVVCLGAAIAVALIFNRKLLLKVDYALLATFVCFFVFVGNIARIDAVRDFFSGILSGRELIVTALLSQVISNVPATIMLAGFTENGTQLLLGADIGGFGTLIASLASLISFQIYRKADNAQTGKYFCVFSTINFALLILLIFIHLFLIV